MAEGEKPGIAQQQVEGAGEQGKAQKLHHEDRIDKERRDQHQAKQRDQQDGADGGRLRMGRDGRRAGRGGGMSGHVRLPFRRGPRDAG
jgi:hypothetical protein